MEHIHTEQEKEIFERIQNVQREIINLNNRVEQNFRKIRKLQDKLLGGQDAKRIS